MTESAKENNAKNNVNPGAGKTVTVRLQRSLAGVRASHRATVAGLGLRKRESQRVLEDTPAVRGMIRKVRHLVVAVDGGK